MRWLLDTCVLSEMVRAERSPGVERWVQEHGMLAGISLVSVGEIQFGIERLAPGRKRNALQHWFDGVRTQYAERTLALEAEVWLSFGRLKASLETIGKPQTDFDLLLAATASVHQLTMVTRNVRHFVDTGVAVVNPWK